MSAQSRAGATIDERYKLLEEIGSGRLSTIYLAADTANGDVSVAVKLLDTRHPDGIKRELFKRETAALKRLQHPNIISLQQSGWSDAEKCFYLVLDYVPYSLEDYLRGKPSQQLDNFNPYRAVRELAGAVAHAHALGVVHRNIKPSNVLIGENGRPRLADFGISKLIDQLTIGETLAKYWSGGYASPEQRAAMPVKPESDVYSLGALFYHLLSKRAPPPEGPTPDLVDEMNGPIRVRSVLKRMLDADPDKRKYEGSSLVESLETITRQVESLPSHYLILTRTAIDSLERGGLRRRSRLRGQSRSGKPRRGSPGRGVHQTGYAQTGPHPDTGRLPTSDMRPDGGVLKVITVHTPHVSNLAKERDNAMPYRAIWEPVQEPPRGQHAGDLNRLLAQLDAHQKESADAQERSRSRREFIQQWLDALNEQKLHLKGRRLEYENVEQIRGGLRFTLGKPPPDDLEWPEDSPLAVETANGKSAEMSVGNLIDIRGTLVSVTGPVGLVPKAEGLCANRRCQEA